MKKILCISLLLIVTAAAFAGDIARFVNLGFSNDGKYFAFGLYGAEEKTFNLYAEMYMVDVRANRFVANGVKQTKYDEKIQPGQDGIGALFSLYRGSNQLIQQYAVNHMTTGRLLYILVNGDEPKSNLEFRDFTAGRRYKIDLIQSQLGAEEAPSAAFHINLTVTEKGGTVKTLTVGLPDYQRKGVIQYRIQRILLSPEGRSLVFVVEKEEQAESGVNIRYMVETVYTD